MGDNTGIAWTDATWNCLRGCSRISEGCRFCYAESSAARFSGSGQPYEGLAVRNGSGAHWTGNIQFVEHLLTQPLHWKTPRRIFVNSMSDLFHEKVRTEWLNRIFAIMALCPHHTFQILTKRAEEMCQFFQDQQLEHHIKGIAWEILGHDRQRKFNHQNILQRPWPLPNVWLGVSVENQHAANERIPWLLKTPAAVRFLSVEPLLGLVDLSPFHIGWYRCPECRHARDPQEDEPLGTDVLCLGFHDECMTEDPLPIDGHHLHWIIVGGESGKDRRPMQLNWLEGVVAQCQAAEIPVFVKQDSALKPGQQGRIPPELWALKQFPKG